MPVGRDSGRDGNRITGKAEWPDGLEEDGPGAQLHGRVGQAGETCKGFGLLSPPPDGRRLCHTPWLDGGQIGSHLHGASGFPGSHESSQGLGLVSRERHGGKESIHDGKGEQEKRNRGK